MGLLSKLKFDVSDGKGLSDQLAFRLAILTPLTIAGVFSIPLAKYDFCFSADSFNFFLEKATLPLGMAALTIPLVAMVSRLFSSAQTAKQIENTEQQNKSKLFLDHYDFLTTHFSKFMDKKLTTVVSINDATTADVEQLYYYLFPNAGLANGPGELNWKFFDDAMLELKSAAHHFSHLIEGINTRNPNRDKDGHATYLANHLAALSAIFCLKIDSKHRSVYNTEKIIPILTDYYAYIATFNMYLGFIEKLGDYCDASTHSYSLRDTIKNFRKQLESLLGPEVDDLRNTNLAINQLNVGFLSKEHTNPG